MFLAISSSFEAHLSSKTNSFFRKWNWSFMIFDDGIFKFGQHSAYLGVQISKLVGNAEAEKKCQFVSFGFDAARGTLSATRFAAAIHRFVTLQAFWDTFENRWRTVRCDENGHPVTISREELLSEWEKVEEQTGQVVWLRSDGARSKDGKYIEDADGSYLLRNWDDVAMDVLIFVARILSPIRWLHGVSACDLGKHATGLSGATMAVWGCVLTLNLVQVLRDWNDETDPEMMPKRTWDAWQGFIDWVAIFPDFGIGAGVPELAIIGSVLNIVSAASLIAREIIFYE